MNSPSTCRALEESLGDLERPKVFSLPKTFPPRANDKCQVPWSRGRLDGDKGEIAGGDDGRRDLGDGQLGVVDRLDIQTRGSGHSRNEQPDRPDMMREAGDRQLIDAIRRQWCVRQRSSRMASANIWRSAGARSIWGCLPT